jgi:hypothetical protein
MSDNWGGRALLEELGSLDLAAHLANAEIQAGAPAAGALLRALATVRALCPLVGEMGAADLNLLARHVSQAWSY